MKKIQLYIIILFTLLVFVNKDLVYSSFSDSINIFVNNVFPSLFTFYILSNLLINYNFIELISIFRLNKLFYLSNNGIFIFIMSVLSGFPSSSIYCSEFLKSKLISSNEANKLMIYSHFSNPLFVIIIVSNILSIKYAYLILICHYLSNILLALLFRNVKIDSINNYIFDKKSFIDCIKDSINKCFKTLLLVFSSIYIFILINQIITKYVHLNKFYDTILSLFFEITGGINNLDKFNASNTIKSLLIGMSLSFGGLSIHLQIKSIISDTSISYHQFLIFRIIQSALTGILIYTSLKVIFLI